MKTKIINEQELEKMIEKAERDFDAAESARQLLDYVEVDVGKDKEMLEIEPVEPPVSALPDTTPALENVRAGETPERTSGSTVDLVVDQFDTSGV